MAAAVPFIASAGIGLLASKLSQPKQQAMPTQRALPAAPDAALMARHAMEAAQTAAGVARARGTAGAQAKPATLLTSPSGIPTPAPVVRKTLLGS